MEAGPTSNGAGARAVLHDPAAEVVGAIGGGCDTGTGIRQGGSDGKPASAAVTTFMWSSADDSISAKGGARRRAQRRPVDGAELCVDRGLRAVGQAGRIPRSVLGGVPRQPEVSHAVVSVGAAPPPTPS